MTEKRFTYGETDLFEWVEDNGKMISTKECVNELNKQQVTIQQLREENKELKKILKKCAKNWKQEIIKRGHLEEEVSYYESQVFTRKN